MRVRRTFILVLLALLAAGSHDAMVRQNASLDGIVQRRAGHMHGAAGLSDAARSAHAQAYQVLTWISGSFPLARVDPPAQELQALAAALDDGAAQGVVRMDEFTQRGSRRVEEAALAARAQQQQALDLGRTVAAFRVDEAVHGADRTHETAPPGTQALRPGGAGRPCLRLASSRGKRS